MAASAAQEAASAPSWETLREKLGGRSVFHLSQAKERLFGSDTAPAVVLYRDNAAWCPYCERVWLQLEEKQISYAVVKVNLSSYGEKPAWFLEMAPLGLVPVVKLNGKVITQSMDIMQALEEAFPDRNPLLAAEEKSTAEELFKLERGLVDAYFSWIRSSAGSSAVEDELGKVDAVLQRSGGPYFLGKQFSLVDAVFAPFLERLAAGALIWKGLVVRGSPRWPSLQAWYDVMDTRPIYQAVKSDDFTVVASLEAAPHLGPFVSAPEAAPHRNRVTGKDGSWDLPLKPEVTAWGKDDGTGQGGAKEEAALTLVGNHQAITGFALRAIPEGAEQFREHLDYALRHVAEALLVGVENTNAGDVLANLPPEVAVAAAYLRDRVSVPRDLSYPAARQLRAHLHWLVGRIGSSTNR